MNPIILTNLVRIITNSQQTKQGDSLYLFALIIGGILFVGVWWIKRQIEKNDDNNTANFSEMKGNIGKISADVTDLRLEIAKDYLVTARFEAHETSNESSIKRVHDRIDDLIKENK